MNTLIGILVAIGGLLAFLFNRQNEKAQVQAKLEETKAKDVELLATQEAAQAAIKEVDDGIERMKQERIASRERDRNMTLKERADKMKKGLK